MNAQDRVLTALSHKQPDKTPYQINFTQNARKKMADFYGDPEFESKLGNCLSLQSYSQRKHWKEIATDIFQDHFGVRWNRSVDKDIGVVCNQLVTAENVNAFIFPDPVDNTRKELYQDFIANSRDRFVVVNLGFSLFERAWTLAGMENILMGMVADKEFVHILLDRILEYNLAIIEDICKLEIDAMMFGDDWGQQSGLIMGPVLWREFIKPRIRQMYSAVKTKGKFVFIHSCGKVDGLFPELIECGLDVFNPFQPEVMDVFEVKKKYGDRLSFYGGVSTQKTLPYGTVQQVKDEVRRLVDKIGEKGGYICSPAHDTPGDAKPENIAAMIEVLQNH
ncbi:MAG: uroporphyrinogen decarboxylase family protein [Kiritimatiellae bacterium]|nr:uroporphyrinogen decarboxylase family protein [Kiritimatiellia bacterium]